MEQEQLHWGPVSAGNAQELCSWGKFKVFQPVEESAKTKSIVGARWALTWKLVGGEKNVKARFSSNGYQDPDLKAAGFS